MQDKSLRRLLSSNLCKISSQCDQALASAISLRDASTDADKRRLRRTTNKLDKIKSLVASIKEDCRKQ